MLAKFRSFDDLFDGWSITERRKREKEKKEAAENVENSRGRGKPRKRDHNEMFYMAGNQEDANQIYSQNDVEARMRLKSKRAVLNKTQDGEIVRDAHMPDTRQDIRMQAAREASESIKKR